MLTPAYKLTIGSKAVDTTHEPKASTVVDLRVELDMDTPADRFVVVLGQVNGLKPALDDQATIELGYADNGGFTKVMTGSVVAVEPGVTRNRVIAYTAAQKLLRSFTDQTVESKPRYRSSRGRNRPLYAPGARVPLDCRGLLRVLAADRSGALHALPLLDCFCSGRRRHD